MKKFLIILSILLFVFLFASCTNENPDVDAPYEDMTEAVETEPQIETFISEYNKKDRDAVIEYSDRLRDEFKSYRSMLNDKKKALYDQLLPYVLSYTPFTISVINKDYDLDDVFAAAQAIRFDYPETWLYFSTATDRAGDRIVSYSSTYFSVNYTMENIENFDKDYVAAYIEKVDGVCDEILQKMPKGISTFEKYFWIANYLCSITEYEMDPYGKFFYADGPLLYGKGICQSYAYAYQWLCHRAGLWCTTCSGVADGESHIWNVVKLDNGKTYYMDLTWADGEQIDNEYYFMTYEKCTESRTIYEGEWIADG